MAGFRRRSRPATAGGEDERLAVLFVNTATLPPLGADTWVHGEIMRHLDRSTHEVHTACVTGPAGRPTPTYELVTGIPDVHVLPTNLGPEVTDRSLPGRVKGLVRTLPAIPNIARMWWTIRRRGITVLHTADRPRDAVACVLLARLTGARCVIHAHVAYADWMGGLLRWSLRRADALIAISDHVARSLIDGGHDRARVHVVHNGIDPQAWQPGVGRDEGRAALRVPPEVPLVITVCRLFPGKGPSELIRAFARLGIDSRLAVVGRDVTPGGTYAAELMALADELGVADRVIFTGQRPDVPALMAAADVFAMPSLGEPFGLVYLEAMAMQLPVVALADGGALEVIDHGGSGLLSAPFDVDALAENLAELLENPQQRAEMGEYGRRRVEERFTSARVARDVADVYALVVSGHHSGGGRAGDDGRAADDT